MTNSASLRRRPTSIRTRLTAIVAAATIVVLGVVGLMMYIVTDLNRTVRDLSNLAELVERTDRLQLSLSRMLVPINSYLVSEDVRYRDAFDSSIQELSTLLRALDRADLQPEWREVAGEVQQRVTLLSTLSVEVLFVEDPVGNPDVVQLMDRVNELAEESILIASRFRGLARNEIVTRRLGVDAQSDLVSRLLVGTVLVVLIGLGLFYLFLTRWISVPLTRLAKGVSSLRSGAISQIDVTSVDEIGEVGLALNELSEHLSASRRDVQIRTRQLEAVYRANRAFGQHSTREGLYQTLTELARTEADAQYAVLVVVDRRGHVVHLTEAGVPPFLRWSEVERQAVIAKFPRPEQPLRLSDQDPDAHLAEVPGPPLRSLMAIPVLTDAEARSHLYVMQKRQDTFSPNDEELVLTICRDAAQAMTVINLYEETERLATIDGLTGFTNRSAFETRLVQEFRHAGSRGQRFALVFADLDHLKDINDRFGHAVGDAAIRRFSDAIRDVIRVTDIVGRYGGDEILLLMPETDLHEATMVANRILARVRAAPLVVEREHVPLSASLGIATYPEHGRDKDALLRSADFALYQAKAAGRGRVQAVRMPGDAPDTTAPAA